MKQGIIIDSPFGLYRLSDAKRDSQQNINHYHDKKIEGRGHSKNAMALITILFLTAWTALGVYAQMA